jgi:hypothetical protein
MSDQFPGHVLEIERTFDAPVEEVFDAWTNEEVLRHWFHDDPEWETPTTEIDLRVGGRLRLAMRDPNAGEDYGASGIHGGGAAAPARLHLAVGRPGLRTAADRARVHRERRNDDRTHDEPWHRNRGARGLPPWGLGSLL